MDERREKGLYWDRAWKLVEGCTKCSPGCDNCWSEQETVMRSNHPNETIRERARAAVHLAQIPGDKTMFDGRILLRHDNLDLPLRTKKPTVWAVWNDLYHEDVSDDFRDRAYAVMASCSQHIFLILTKRSERMAKYTKTLFPMGTGLSFIWHGVTIENQRTADERILHLLLVPGRRFLSIEPTLGPIDLLNLERPFDFHRSPYGWPEWLGRNLHQITLGGESGKNARPMNPVWARSVRDQCAAAGIPYFHKQNGEWASVSEVEGPGKHHYFPTGETVRRVGKKKAGRLLDGLLHDELAWDKTQLERSQKMHFVMIWSQDGRSAMPMVDADGEVAFYTTESDARIAAKHHALCLAFGYEIHCMGMGDE